MSFVGPHSPTDVVDAVGDDEHSRSVNEDVLFQPGQSARTRVASTTGVDEHDPAVRKSKERVVLDDFAVRAGGGDAVTEEDDPVAVAEFEVRRGACKECKENAGVIKKLFLMNNDTELWAQVEWTKKGREDILDKRYVYVSADINFNYMDNETKVEHGPTLNGAALTNRPFIKNMAPVIELSEHKFNNHKPQKRNEKMTKEEIQAIVEGVTTNVTAKFDEKFKEVSDKVSSMEEKFKGTEEKQVQMSEQQKSELEMKRREADFNVKLSEGVVVPAQKDAYVKGDMEAFLKLSQPSVKTKTIGDAGTESVVELDDSQFAEKVRKEAVALSKERGIPFEQAQKEVVRSNKEYRSKWEEKFSIRK